MSTKYGIISDCHKHPEFASIAGEALIHAGAERLIVNGDMSGQGIYFSTRGEIFIDESMFSLHILKSLEQVANEAKIDVWVQPGSHEMYEQYGLWMNLWAELNQSYGNRIHDCIKEQVLEADNHRIVFVPGSDIGPGSYKQIQGLKTGYKPAGEGCWYNFNLEDIASLVEKPERTIIVTHVPKRFEATPENPDSPDTARFFTVNYDCVRNGQLFGMGSILPYLECPHFVHDKAFTLHVENRGNILLQSTMHELGITKSVCGHFHESAWNAINDSGQRVTSFEWTECLHYNASYIDGMKAGLVAVDGEKIMYHNVDFSAQVRRIYSLRSSVQNRKIIMPGDINRNQPGTADETENNQGMKHSMEPKSSKIPTDKKDTNPASKSAPTSASHIVAYSEAEFRRLLREKK